MNSSTMFTIKKTKDKRGQGTFAQRNITANTVIHSERPLFTFNQDASQAAVIHMIQHLDPSARTQFISLHNPFPNPSEHEDLASMAETNSLPLHTPTGQAHSGVFPQAARVNHSCAPNAEHTWDADNHSLKIRAIHNIKRHEEITISYLPNCPSYLIRQVYLKATYNFNCQCELCERSFSFKKAKRACLTRICGLKFGEIEDVDRRRTEVRGAYAMLRQLLYEVREQGRPKEWLTQVLVLASEVAIADGDRARATVFLWRAALELEAGIGDGDGKGEDEEMSGLILSFQNLVRTLLDTLEADTERVWRTEVGDVPYELQGDEAEFWLWEGDQAAEKY